MPEDLGVNLGEIDDVNNSAKLVLYTRYRLATIVAITFVVVSIAVQLVVLAVSGDFIVHLFILPWLVLAVGYKYVVGKVSNIFMKQFAMANGYAYQEKGDLVGRSGFAFAHGHSKRITNVIQGQYQGKAIELFNYGYTVGHGKSARNYRFTVMNVSYQHDLPHIFLHDRKDNFGASPILYFKNDQVLELNHEFSKNYLLLVPKGLHHEALQVFTPDFIHDLIERWSDFGLEFVSQRICIHHFGRIGTKKELYELYALAKYLIEKISPRLAALQRSLAATAEYFPNKL